MNWILHNNSLHFKEDCKPCGGNGCDDKGTIIGRCAKCNGEGHTYTKAEAPTKPDIRGFWNVPKYEDAMDKYNSQLSLIKELEEALMVTAPSRRPEKTWVPDWTRWERVLTEEKQYKEAQTLLSKYIFDGEIKERK